MPPEELVVLVDFRYLTDALTPAEALALLRRGMRGRDARTRHLLAHGYPAYATSPGWLGYDDDKLRRLCREAVADGFTQIKLKVGADIDDDIRRMQTAREACGPGIRIAIDANQRWDVGRRGRLDRGAGPVRPVVGGGTHQPRRRARATPRSPAASRRSRSPPASTCRTGSCSSNCSSSARSRSSSSTPPGSPGSTRTSRSCCWPPSSACRSARTRAASGCASWCSTCRCSTTSRSPARWTTGSSSTSTTCTSTSPIPCGSAPGATSPPPHPASVRRCGPKAGPGSRFPTVPLGRQYELRPPLKDIVRWT